MYCENHSIVEEKVVEKCSHQATHRFVFCDRDEEGRLGTFVYYLCDLDVWVYHSRQSNSWFIEKLDEKILS